MKNIAPKIFNSKLQEFGLIILPALASFLIWNAFTIQSVNPHRNPANTAATCASLFNELDPTRTDSTSPLFRYKAQHTSSYPKRELRGGRLAQLHFDPSNLSGQTMSVLNPLLSGPPLSVDIGASAIRWHEPSGKYFFNYRLPESFGVCAKLAVSEAIFPEIAGFRVILIENPTYEPTFNKNIIRAPKLEAATLTAGPDQAQIEFIRWDGTIVKPEPAFVKEFARVVEEARLDLDVTTGSAEAAFHQSPLLNAEKYSLPPNNGSGSNFYVIEAVDGYLTQVPNFQTTRRPTTDRYHRNVDAFTIQPTDGRFDYALNYRTGIATSILGTQLIQDLSGTKYPVRFLMKESEIKRMPIGDPKRSSSSDGTGPRMLMTLDVFETVVEINGHRISLLDLLYYVEKDGKGDPSSGLIALASGKLDGYFETTRNVVSTENNVLPAPVAAKAQPASPPILLATKDISQTREQAPPVPAPVSAVAQRPVGQSLAVLPRGGALAETTNQPGTVVALDAAQRGRERILEIIEKTEGKEARMQFVANAENVRALNRQLDDVVKSSGEGQITQLKVTIAELKERVGRQGEIGEEAGKALAELEKVTAGLAPAPIRPLGRFANLVKDLPLVGGLVNRVADETAKFRTAGETLQRLAKNIESMEIRLEAERVEITTRVEYLAECYRKLLEVQELAESTSKFAKQLSTTLKAKSRDPRLAAQDRITLNELNILLAELDAYRGAYAERINETLNTIDQLGQTHQNIRILVTNLRAELGTTVYQLTNNVMVLQTGQHLENGVAQVEALRDARQVFQQGAADKTKHLADIPKRLANASGNVKAIEAAIKTTQEARIKGEQSLEKAREARQKAIDALNGMRPTVTVIELDASLVEVKRLESHSTPE